MLCPKCGQSQPTAEQRFCARCGFQQTEVRRLLGVGGVLAEPGAEEGKTGFAPRQQGVRQGLMLGLSTLIVTPVTATFLVLLGLQGRIVPVLPLTMVLCITAGLLRILYAGVVQEGRPREREP